MALIPKDETTKMLSIIDGKDVVKLPRPYLGMSQIGEECLRKLQYYWRWADYDRYPARIARLFKTGHDAEEFMVHDIHQVGGRVYGRQNEYVGTAGHWKGHGDGLCENIPGYEGKILLLEMKTHNDKYFKLLVKDKVKKAYPKHYAQMQRYMWEEKAETALYYAYNKNDSSYYVEFVDIDPAYCKELIEKELTVIASDKLHPKIGSGTPTWFACKFCNYNEVCHKGKPIVKTCRSCKHVDILDEGKWVCSISNSDLDAFEQEHMFMCDKGESYELDEEYFNA